MAVVQVGHLEVYRALRRHTLCNGGHYGCYRSPNPLQLM